MKQLIKKILCVFTAAAALVVQTAGSADAADIKIFDRTRDMAVMKADPPEPEKELVYSEIPVSSFTVSGLAPGINTDKDRVDWWFSEWEDCRYIFLPSTADRSSLVITYGCDETLYLNDTPVVSGESTSLLDSADEFTVRAGDKDCGKLKVMQSELGCIFLSTKSGGLDLLDANMQYTETGSALMLDPDGGIVFSGDIDKLTAHGNSSWHYSKKKSYNVKLDKKADLYGMGKAKKWALISNYLDHSMVRNKVTEEMCKAVGAQCVMDSVFVDLYADGSYRGTYQLYERVQIQKNRVNIRDLEEETEKLNESDLSEYPRRVKGASGVGEYMENSFKYYDIPNDPADITGGYLMQFQLWNRYGYKANSGFVTSRGQAVELDGPEYASEAQINYIRSFVQDAEDAVYSDTGFNSKGKHYSDYFDMDSLVTAYLVQEISMNIDATTTSFFLWKDSDVNGDGKLHFCPSWDFDFAYGCFPASVKNSDGKSGYSCWTNNLYAAYFPISGYQTSERPAEGVSWIGMLYKRDSFRKMAARRFTQRFSPFLTELTQGEDPGIMQIAGAMENSAGMNNARWHTYGGAEYCVFGSSSGKDFLGSVELVRRFAGDRNEWLGELWKDDLYPDGDVNGDGVLDAADLESLERWLLGADGAELAASDAADLSGDGRTDTFDLCLMRQRIAEVQS